MKHFYLCLFTLILFTFSNQIKLEIHSLKPTKETKPSSSKNGKISKSSKLVKPEKSQLIKKAKITNAKAKIAKRNAKAKTTTPLLKVEYYSDLKYQFIKNYTRATLDDFIKIGFLSLKTLPDPSLSQIDYDICNLHYPNTACTPSDMTKIQTINSFTALKINQECANLQSQLLCLFRCTNINNPFVNFNKKEEVFILRISKATCFNLFIACSKDQTESTRNNYINFCESINLGYNLKTLIKVEEEKYIYLPNTDMRTFMSKPNQEEVTIKKNKAIDQNLSLVSEYVMAKFNEIFTEKIKNLNDNIKMDSIMTIENVDKHLYVALKMVYPGFALQELKNQIKVLKIIRTFVEFLKFQNKLNKMSKESMTRYLTFIISKICNLLRFFDDDSFSTKKTLLIKVIFEREDAKALIALLYNSFEYTDYYYSTKWNANEEFKTYYEKNYFFIWPLDNKWENEFKDLTIVLNDELKQMKNVSRVFDALNQNRYNAIKKELFSNTSLDNSTELFALFSDGLSSQELIEKTKSIWNSFNNIDLSTFGSANSVEEDLQNLQSLYINITTNTTSSLKAASNKTQEKVVSKGNKEVNNLYKNYNGSISSNSSVKIKPKNKPKPQGYNNTKVVSKDINITSQSNNSVIKEEKKQKFNTTKISSNSNNTNLKETIKTVQQNQTSIEKKTINNQNITINPTDTFKAKNEGLSKNQNKTTNQKANNITIEKSSQNKTKEKESYNNTILVNKTSEKQVSNKTKMNNNEKVYNYTEEVKMSNKSVLEKKSNSEKSAINKTIEKDSHNKTEDTNNQNAKSNSMNNNKTQSNKTTISSQTKKEKSSNETKNNSSKSSNKTLDNLSNNKTSYHNNSSVSVKEKNNQTSNPNNTVGVTTNSDNIQINSQTQTTTITSTATPQATGTTTQVKSTTNIKVVSTPIYNKQKADSTIKLTLNTQNSSSENQTATQSQDNTNDYSESAILFNSTTIGLVSYDSILLFQVIFYYGAVILLALGFILMVKFLINKCYDFFVFHNYKTNSSNYSTLFITMGICLVVNVTIGILLYSDLLIISILAFDSLFIAASLVFHYEHGKVFGPLGFSIFGLLVSYKLIPVNMIPLKILLSSIAAITLFFLGAFIGVKRFFTYERNKSEDKVRKPMQRGSSLMASRLIDESSIIQ
jgi:hypothetical protein